MLSMRHSRRDTAYQTDQRMMDMLLLYLSDTDCLTKLDKDGLPHLPTLFELVLVLTAYHHGQRI